MTATFRGRAQSGPRLHRREGLGREGPPVALANGRPIEGAAAHGELAPSASRALCSRLRRRRAVTTGPSSRYRPRLRASTGNVPLISQIRAVEDLKPCGGSTWLKTTGPPPLRCISGAAQVFGRMATFLAASNIWSKPDQKSIGLYDQISLLSPGYVHISLYNVLDLSRVNNNIRIIHIQDTLSKFHHIGQSTFPTFDIRI